MNKTRSIWQWDRDCRASLERSRARRSKASHARIAAFSEWLVLGLLLLAFLLVLIFFRV